MCDRLGRYVTLADLFASGVVDLESCIGPGQSGLGGFLRVG
jgi:hypothetical protein